MSSTIECFGKIYNKRELNRNSIFLLSYQNEREKGEKPERDFEFFVFVDPQKDEERPDFLNVLYHYLIKDTFPEPAEKYINDLKNWLKVDDENGSLINPLNWLKIAIERYPYRLFVVIDPENKKWKDGEYSPLDEEFWFNGDPPPPEPEQWKRSPFLYKRICWVERGDFESAIKGNISDFLNEYNEQLNKEEKFKLWLYVRWIEHLLRRVRSIDKKNIVLSLIYKPDDSNGSSSPAHNISTLPQEMIPAVVGQGVEINNRLIDIINVGGGNVSNESNNVLISYSRHRDLLSRVQEDVRLQPAPDNITKNIMKNCVYSEYLTGALEYFTMLINSEPPTQYTHFLTTCLMVENGLLRLGISDERVLEWWQGLDEIKCALTLSKRLIPMCWKNNGDYGQPSVEQSKALVFNSEGNYNFTFLKDNGTLKELYDLSFDGVNKQMNIDAYIIHLGILQKDEQFWNNRMKDILGMKDYIPFVIVTSGRGVPPELPIGTKFIPFSVIETFIMRQEPHKLLLTKIIGTIKMEVKDE